MRITAINNFNSRPIFGNSEGNQADYIENQTKQVLRDSFETIKAETRQKVSQEIEGKYRDEFVRKIEDSKKKINTDDMINIFTELQEAYKEAGMDTDANALSIYVKKLANGVKKCT